MVGVSQIHRHGKRPRNGRAALNRRSVSEHEVHGRVEIAIDAAPGRGRHVGAQIEQLCRGTGGGDRHCEFDLRHHVVDVGDDPRRHHHRRRPGTGRRHDRVEPRLDRCRKARECGGTATEVGRGIRRQR